MTKIYFAAPLFSEADKMFNAHVYSRLREVLDMWGGYDIEIYFPQDNKSINDKNAYASAQDITNADYNELSESDIFIALLDGEDSGVALEAGIAYERGIPMFGLWTDARQLGGDNQQKLDAIKNIGQNQFMYINLMLSGLFLNRNGLYGNVSDFVSAICAHVLT